MIINRNIYNIIIDKLYYLKWLDSIKKVNQEIINKCFVTYVYNLNFLFVNMKYLKYTA